MERETGFEPATNSLEGCVSDRVSLSKPASWIGRRQFGKHPGSIWSDFALHKRLRPTSENLTLPR